MKNRQLNIFPPTEEERTTASEDTRITLALQKSKKEVFSSTQKKFNSLTKRIQKQKASLEQIPQKTEYLKAFYKENIALVRSKSKDIAVDNVKEIASRYDSSKLSQKRKTELGDFLINYLYDFKESFEEDEQVQTLADEFLDKYWEAVTSQSKDERSQEEIDIVLDMAEAFFGEDFEDLATDATDADDLMAKIAEKMRNEQDKEDVSAADAPPAAKTKKSKKEAQKELQAQMEQKTLRNIYIELVKELHPDTAKDEDDRRLKETRMKQLTEAYRTKDLYSLLTMQYNWLEESAQDFSRQPDNILKQYNKLMNEQLRLMEDEYNYYCSLPIHGLPLSFNQYLLVENHNYLDQLLFNEKQEAAEFLLNEQSLKEILTDSKELKRFIDMRIANNKHTSPNADMLDLLDQISRYK